MILFVVVGPTNFAPNWCLGIIQEEESQHKREYCQSSGQLCQCNVSQLVGQTDGTILVPTYDWASFFDQPMIQSSLKGISKIHPSVTTVIIKNVELTFFVINRGNHYHMSYPKKLYHQDLALRDNGIYITRSESFARTQ